MLLPQEQKKCTKAGSDWSVLDYLPSIDLPSLPDGLVNFSAGLGDALLFGLGNPARDLLGINGSVDRGTGAYRATFRYLSDNFAVTEPFGDNSRYWVGPVEPSTRRDITAIEARLRVFLPSALRRIFGSLITLDFAALKGR